MTPKNLVWRHSLLCLTTTNYSSFPCLTLCSLNILLLPPYYFSTLLNYGSGVYDTLSLINIDMTHPTQQCPDGFKPIDRTEPPLRTCGRPDGFTGCLSTTFPVYGTEYSRVCGRIVGYQFGSPSGFDTLESSIDCDYIAGISLTHGLPRQHIWSSVNAQNEGTLILMRFVHAFRTALLASRCLLVMTIFVILLSEEVIALQAYTILMTHSKGAGG